MKQTNPIRRTPVVRSTKAIATLGLAAMVIGGACGDGTDASSGARWRDFVRSDKYTRLVIETDYVEGLKPDGDDKLSGPLSAAIDKPDGIAIVLDETLPATPGKVWTLAELEARMDAHASLVLDATTTRIHTLVVDGSYEGDDADGTVLGVAWGGDRLVLFGDSIKDACAVAGGALNPALLCRAVRNSVWMHEIGHLLGLVDNGLPMTSDHRDPDPAHGRHDANPDCLMYWATNRSAVVQRVIEAMGQGNGDNALTFDAACQADLAAARSNP